MQKYQQISKKCNCPICCTDNSHVLWGMSSKKAAQHFVLKEKFPDRFLELASHIENLWGKGSCEVVQCDNCGFVYSNPYVAGDEKFYSLAYARSGYPKWKWEFQLTYDVLNNRLDPNFRLLEIGAGDGAFVRKIAESVIPRENITCTEFSKYGRHQIEQFGIKCLSEDIRNVSKEYRGNFDAICMFQVLEHMDRLDKLFQALNLMIKEGGSLFVAVPNQNRTKFNELNGALLDMPPNHIGRWNKKSFEEIGRKNGFRIKDYKVEKSSFILMAKQFIIYRMMRKSQRSGSFENRIFRLDNFYLLRLMQVIGLVAHSVMAIPALAKINSAQGISQWVHFTKTKD